MANVTLAVHIDRLNIWRKFKTYELAASLKPFSIAGTKFEGKAWPTSKFSNSNLVPEPCSRGSIYLSEKENQSKWVLPIVKEPFPSCHHARVLFMDNQSWERRYYAHSRQNSGCSHVAVSRKHNQISVYETKKYDKSTNIIQLRFLMHMNCDK